MKKQKISRNRLSQLISKNQAVSKSVEKSNLELGSMAGTIFLSPDNNFGKQDQLRQIEQDAFTTQ